ncbi:MAG: GTP 3',8-cyclase MoaA [Peptoniphilaceae bacterium]|nr:GTP 3',8-cyclase MoaA [Peptoniphilaceae bacterium]MDY6018751.1 GTP 3',8-cyclase MoaA [Anaerococcus sp.]
MLDNFNRNINYLRISLTDLCNFRCKYCMPKDGIYKKPRSEILTFEEIYYIAHLFVENGIDKIRITGGEPLIRKGVVNFVESLGSLEKIKDLAMTTNASLLKDKAYSLKKAGLDRVNVSLDTLNPKTFKDLTGGDLKDVLDGIKAAADVGLGIKLNTVLLKGINEKEINDFLNLTYQYDIDVRFIEVMPIGPTASYAKDKFLSCDDIIENTNLRKIDNKDPSSPASLYKLEGAKGRVGFIEPISHKFCKSCNRLRLTSDGYLKACLHSDRLIDLKTPLRKGEDIRPFIEEALKIKPLKHRLEDGRSIVESMNRIGG